MNEREQHTVILLVAIVATMTVLSFASVPLYRVFCQATGFGGTPKIAIEAPGVSLERQVKVRFNTDASPNLPWRFKPLQREMTVQVGESSLAFFEVENLSTRDISGWATYNVTPNKAGPYFAKMLCFCFSEQVIPAGKKFSLPVSFFIDPKIIDDTSLKSVDTITLSYTFFEFKGQNK
jgi:cytochrome c oxidase assembly protein subunit 11